MKRWIVPFVVCLIFIILTVIFLTPSLTADCTVELLLCLENASHASFWTKLGYHLVCVYHNVICVLGGLFS